MALSHQVLEMDPDALFSVTPVDQAPPSKARTHASLPCSSCGEDVMETRVRRLDGADLCQPCFEAATALA